MVQTRLIYGSRPLGYDRLELDDILRTAPRVTGRLASPARWSAAGTCSCNCWRGPAEAVDATYVRIRRDRRHVEVTLLGSGQAARRLFPDWPMRGDVTPPGLWSHADVLAGRHATAPFGEALALFECTGTERQGPPGE